MILREKKMRKKNVRHKNHKKRWETQTEKTQPQPYNKWKAIIIYSLIHSSLNSSFNFQKLSSSITTTLSFFLSFSLLSSPLSSIAAAHYLIFFSSNGFGRSIRRQFLSPGTILISIFLSLLCLLGNWLILCRVCAGEQ